MVRSRFSYRSFIEVGCYLLPALTFISIWLPMVRHYYVPSITLGSEILNDARLSPSDQLLENLQEFYFFTPIRTNEPRLVDTARKLLQGDMESLGYPGERISVPFAAIDLDRLPGSLQLLLAKFAVPRILLAAYRSTGREEFIGMARDVILGWALYERRAWVPRGFLWHDTAVAERILVLAEFWRLYRHHPAFDPEAAKTILELAARSGQFLAKPTHYTFSSNHGIMQNLALWHLCIAFPTLPSVEQYKQLAFDRMRDQMALYLNDEGVVLEHSAGYQEHGLRFIGMALRYVSLLNLPMPEDWIQKYEKAKNFYAHLRRPDGSLPVFGDTTGGLNPYGPPIVTTDDHKRADGWQLESNWRPRQANSLYPVAGYSIWWSGLAFWPKAEGLAQTVVAWSNFPGHPHKHADEMSVLVWAGGQTWWTNVGYWPYDGLGRSGATSWNGSSAPHLIGEEPRSARTTSLRSFGWSDHLAMLDLERNGPQRARIRRQLVYMKPHLWLVLDHFIGQGMARTTWTTSHNVSLSEGEIPGSYQLRAKDISSSLAAFVWGIEGTQVKPMRGSLRPFAGWEVVGSRPQPAPAIVVEQPAHHSWSAVVWSLDDSVTPARHLERQPYMAAWKDAENWEIALPIKSGLLEIQREDNTIVARDRSNVGSDISLELTKAQDLTQTISQIHNSYAIARDKYPQFRGNFPSRLKITKLLVVLFVIQEILLFMYRKVVRTGYLAIRLCNVIGWVAIGLWLNMVKFGI
jgi:Heparinase II/III N-terminus/Heparinase II/III-like protein